MPGLCLRVSDNRKEKNRLIKVDDYEREITSKMQAHVNADEAYLITSKTVLDLSKRTKSIFLSSKMPEKQQ